MAEATSSSSLPSTTPHDALAAPSSSSNPDTPGIPIAMIGAYEQVGVQLARLLVPEFDTVHHSLIKHALAELPRLLAGDLAVPQETGIGSNASRKAQDRRIPVAMILGREVPMEMEGQILEKVRELEAEKKDAQSVRRSVKFIRVGAPDKSIIGKGGPPDVGMLAELLRGKLREALGGGEES
ncbi:uncharacterized protein BDZ99DRAFT_498154 [Mytilinidion resinicola]|uniref:Uncharacterized protein n=1 Tax=Mytilinidion resinicola TaxID=574789 RepID=A0A6A6YMZ7_9PEZI|nr:uncharacterized protein BDZ99DRAFT_498154 [Mytilinidion resinicola]KAF2809918.1 hypothetical protein BDZ99DRAFT_498154 [Mytilinidion resinicola]